MSGEIPAGWYRSPNEHNVLRYWDGELWTDQVRSTAPAPGPTPQVEEAEVVRDALAPGEVIEAGFNTRVFRATFYIATNKRLFVVEPRGTRGHEVFTHPYPSIERISCDEGSFEIHVGGRKIDDTSVHESTVHQFVDYVRGRISQSADTNLSTLPPPSPVHSPIDAQHPADGPRSHEPTLGSLADELIKVAELHRNGALTDDEFAAAKAKLLED